MELSKHFQDMLKERSIQQKWVEKTLAEPEKIEDYKDGTKHFLCRIPDHGNRWLRIIVNIQSEPNKAITAFFDRRVR